MYQTHKRNTYDNKALFVLRDERKHDDEGRRAPRKNSAGEVSCIARGELQSEMPVETQARRTTRTALLTFIWLSQSA